MLIEAIEIYHVALPWKQPQPSPCGESTALETVLVRVCSEGIAGWGEASPGNAPCDSGEWAAGAFALLRDWLAPALLGQDITSAENFNERLSRFQGNQFAKGALDAAWWDLKARMQSVPLHKLLGAERSEVEVGPTLDRMDSPSDFLARLGGYVDAGFARVKLMIRPGWAIEMLRGVRQDFPNVPLYADCAGALALAQMETFYRFDDFCLAALEQPLAADDLVGHAMLQESLRTPICLDEGMRSLLNAEIAFDLNSCRKVNLHAPRVGGLTEALAILKACGDNEVSCYGGTRPQSGIGTRIDLALACRIPGNIQGNEPADFFDGTMLADDLVEPLVPQRNSATGNMTLAASAGIGLGVEPDLAKMKRYTLATASIS